MFSKNNNKFSFTILYMDNPEVIHRPISEGGITVHKAHWDFPQYRTPKQYPGKEIRSGIQKPTKKGFYMDYILKIAKGIPSARILFHNYRTI